MKVRIYYKNGLDETFLNIEQIVEDVESVIMFIDETPPKRGYMTTPKEIIEKLIVEVK